MAEILDRMGRSINIMAKEKRQEEALRFAAENPPTLEQLQLAKEGLPAAVSGVGTITGDVTYFGQALKKARSLQISSAFEMEGMNELTRLLGDVNNGVIKADQVREKVASISAGYTNALNKIDPEAAIKFNATFATHGNTILKAAYEADAKRLKEESTIKVRENLNNAKRVLPTLITMGNYTDPDTQQTYTFMAYVDLLRSNLKTQTLAVGDASLAKEILDDFDKELPKIMQSTLLDRLSKENFLSKPNDAIKALRNGIVAQDGGATNLASWMLNNDKATLQDTIKKFGAMASERKQMIELAYVDDAQKGDTLLREIFATTDPKLMRSKFVELTALAVDPSKIKEANNWIKEQTKPKDQEDNVEVLVDAFARARSGNLTAGQLARLPLSKETKRSLAKEIGGTNNDFAYGAKLIEYAGGMTSENLPPQFDSAEGKRLASETIATQKASLLRFTNTPNSKGLLPTPAEIRAEGERLANGVKPLMSRSFNTEANKQRNNAELFVPELKGVDLNSEAAVNAAMAKAVTAKRTQTDINAARSAIQKHKEAIKNVQGEK